VYIDTYVKTFLILYPLFENSTTRIAILLVLAKKNPLKLGMIFKWLFQKFSLLDLQNVCMCASELERVIRYKSGDKKTVRSRCATVTFVRLWDSGEAPART
jgi:hypothetical protein